MAHWIIIRKPEGGMPGLMGPYTSFTAQQVADKLEVPNEIVQTVSSDPVRAKREMKEQLIQEVGYRKGSKNIRKPVLTIEE